MLYVLHGSDTLKVADRTRDLVASLRAKRPDAQVFTFEGAIENIAGLDELVEARGLFTQKHVVVLKEPFLTAESRDAVLARLPGFAASEHVFIIREGKVDAAHKHALTEHAAKHEEHTRASERPFDVFALADALGARDTKALWLGYLTARRNGLEPESISGTLHYAVKAMLAASCTASADDAGMKEYPYGKFKRFSRNYTKEELAALSRSLVTLYHEAHRGRYDLDTALERWTLSPLEVVH